MARYDEAAAQVHAIADRFRAVMDLSDALKKLGSVDQAIVESQAAFEAAEKRHAAAIEEAKVVEAAIAEMKSRSESQLAAVREEVGVIQGAAHANAAKIVAAAQEEAARIRADAEFAAAATAEVTANRLAEVNQSITDRKADLAAIIAEVNAALAELETTKAKTDELKKFAENILKRE